MSQVAKLKAAGVIGTDAVFSVADNTFIENLSDTEVDALISIFGKSAPSGFWSRNCGSSSPTPTGSQSIGIVF